jgi:small subunit ribosomal protein S8
MKVTDPIADYLTRIRNTIMSRQKALSIPYSKTKESISRILVENNFLEKCEITEKGIFKKLDVTLRYDNGKNAISELKRISKPGRRMYSKVEDLKPIKQGYGIAIVSTSRGIIDDTEAREKKIGGEVLCTIW